MQTTFAPQERRSLLGYSLFVSAAHLLGWGLLIWLSIGRPELLVLGALAYGFGIRHALDADHIAAIDNVTRKLLHDGVPSLGTGFYFSLGHSSVVFVVAVGLGLFAQGAMAGLTAHLARVGGIVGTAISGLCLILIGIMNLFVLVRSWRNDRSSSSDPAGDPSITASGGLLARIFGRFFGLIRRSRQMFAVGALFGLGFDTASEIALLTLSATAAAGGWPFLSVVSLPVLFAAGMALVDTGDGVLIAKAYSWSTRSRKRGRVYNLAVTGVSVCAALAIGAIELSRLPIGLPSKPGSSEGFFGPVQGWTVGAAITAVLVFVWLAAALHARRRRLVDRQVSES